MFSVLFEVHPRGEQGDAYLGYAKMLRPELEGIDGFVDNIRYRSLTRPGWILSLSNWRDEKALVRWRTRARHHEVQVKGREEVLSDYHLRVGQITSDTHVPAGYRLEEQRLDLTETGEGSMVTLTNPLAPYEEMAIEESHALEIAAALGLRTDADGLMSWDVFDAVLEPGNPILLRSWRDAAAAPQQIDDSAIRARHVRIIRDYGMFDRRETPQYYPEIVPQNAATSGSG
ncbi:antibiotic biosynthesis monooxygenase [Mycobacterium sp. HNNTM2301]|uniref:antibiotic biosynthesis monooxygenase family protein n=1 Tax=Mycobacterium hainanense TaxID=3289775 RepID=UPI0035A5CA8B